MKISEGKLYRIAAEGLSAGAFLLQPVLFDLTAGPGI
jgi:hypothetical protein